jgi:hypothetical protein
MKSTKFSVSVEQTNGNDWAAGGTFDSRAEARRDGQRVIASRKAQGLGSGPYKIVVKEVR